MKLDSPVLSLLKTEYAKVDASTEIETIHLIFSHSSNRFLPVVWDSKFVGVILREDFYRKFLADDDNSLTAKDLISKEMVMLSPENTVADALEVFGTNLFNVLPVANDDGHLLGMLHVEDVGKIFFETSTTYQAFQTPLHA